MNFLVLALDVTCDAFPLEDFLQGDARRFSPHITILPRFTSKEIGAVVLPRFDMREYIPMSIELRGPKEIDDKLEWYECGPMETGFDRLIAAHNEMLSLFASFVQPADSRHWGQKYRPHMTIRSNGVCASSLNLPDSISVRPLELVLYEYALSETGPAKRRPLLTS